MKKKIVCGILICLMGLCTTACNVTVNGKTVINASEEDVEKLKEAGKAAGDVMKDIITDEEVKQSVKDVADSIKNAAEQ